MEKDKQGPPWEYLTTTIPPAFQPARIMSPVSRFGAPSSGLPHGSNTTRHCSPACTRAAPPWILNFQFCPILLKERYPSVGRKKGKYNSAIYTLRFVCLIEPRRWACGCVPLAHAAHTVRAGQHSGVVQSWSCCVGVCPTCTRSERTAFRSSAELVLPCGCVSHLHTRHTVRGQRSGVV